MKEQDDLLGVRLPGSQRSCRERGYHLLEKGYTVQEISRLLAVNPTTVRRWRNGMLRATASPIANCGGKGRPCQMQNSEIRRVARFLSRSPKTYGISEIDWTTPLITGLISIILDRPWGYKSTRSFMRNLGWTSLGPKEKWKPPRLL